MDDLKKIGKALLFPPLIIMILLIPVATVFLIYAMVVLGSETIPAYISYVLAAYTLTIWCMRIPRIVKWAKTFKNENRYAVRLTEDVRLRVNISLFGSLIWNLAYALFQIWLGVTNQSLWFYALGGYYISLAFMRFFMFAYTRKCQPGEHMQIELKKYRACGWIFLVMNVALTTMIVFMIYWNRTFEHDQITTIALAAYTFTALTVAIVNLVKYRRYESPVYSASKAISLAAASVSMLTLTSTMLTTFGEGEDPMFHRLMLGTIGGAVSALIIVMAVYMIVHGTHKLKTLQTEVNHGS